MTDNLKKTRISIPKKIYKNSLAWFYARPGKTNAALPREVRPSTAVAKRPGGAHTDR
ncbi:hypothetical protein [Reichenbachiella agariperforans]|uniref:hypothetical protein n=1 Tax=Reichenbachiella agariperforans TaxID=156994 RepID=UPI001C0826CD|nr:hypothetical protein [Reichenbachiella agariperforans]MBU2915966.1 hypothetical protein [Reichenbachiella agariperforans]